MTNNCKDIAEMFSETFEHNDNGTDTDKLKNKSTALQILQLHTKRIAEDMQMNLTNAAEIKKIVVKMKSKTSYGYDGIPITIIKENIDILSESLAGCLSNCIKMNIFPDQLKIARILPIFKKGTKTDPGNYRPIS